MPGNELKISIDGLETGMYVSRLDKPWIETPFTLEGMAIKTKNDIEILRRYTSYVYVDTDQGSTPDPKHWISISPNKLSLEDDEQAPVIAFKKPKNNEYTKLRRAFYEIETEFEEELKVAKEVKSRLEKDLKKVLVDITKGDELDINLLKQGIEASVASILRNPSAFSLLAQLEKSDEYSYSHALSTSIWCAQFGRHLGLEKSDIELLALGGMLLDIGKLQLPPKLLHSTAPLTPEENIAMQQHVDLSVRILAKSKTVPAKILRMVATHHERFDTSGYPNALPNKEIPIFGRIAGIVDSYDAMTTSRPYNTKPYSPNDAINELYGLRDKTFQPELIEQFIQTVGLYPTGSLVELNSGAVAVVLEVNDLKRLYPTIMLILNSDKIPLEEFITIDLSTEKTAGLKVEKALPTGAYGIQLDQLFL